MEIIKPSAIKFARARHGHVIELIREGWNNYNFIFYIGSISALLGSVFGFAGWLSTIVTVYLFYLAGKFKREVDIERKRIEAEEKARKRTKS